MDERSPESILHEADYWVHVNQDIGALNELVGESARKLLEIPISLLTLTVALPPGSPAVEAAERISRGTAEAMKLLRVMQQRIENIADLSSGRLVTLRREGGLPPKEGEPSS